jgi:hypothetical protein
VCHGQARDPRTNNSNLFVDQDDARLTKFSKEFQRAFIARFFSIA